MECHSALTKKEILSFTATWMKLGDIMLNNEISEVSQKEKDKYCTYDLTYLWNLKNKQPNS